MELVKENISNERLSKRLEVSDWRKKIREAADFYAALSVRSHLWDIIRKLRYEYTCAKCGVKKEEFTAYEKGSKKYCSYECKDEDNKDKDNSVPTRRGKFGVSNLSEFFDWMKKIGVTRIEFDFDTNQVIIECNGGKRLDINNSGLSPRLQDELTTQLKSSKEPITFSEVSQELGYKNKKNNNAAIIGFIVVIGVILLVIGAIFVISSSRSRRRDY